MKSNNKVALKGSNQPKGKSTSQYSTSGRVSATPKVIKM